MSYRGRLIAPLWAEIHRLDTEATKADDGYDPVWKTPRVKYSDDGERARSAVYMSPVIVKVQVEQNVEAQQQRAPGGTIPDSKLVLVVHYVDLAAASLVDSDGRPKIRPNDKLTRLLLRTGEVEKVFSPELYATEVLDGGYGLGGRRNLAMITFEDRPKGV